ncbi:hypothetical protein TESG_06160 [Trichophyton tonsurans CBS 112818]|uniref:Uncharacterized protein n=1 Tax=Trichophyton tonsurans (strain CBS 112818) TaxID=647933 RepID=F2S531_TRIT1|nr:hypothetical protein TESG_06160 [Trichophyton tonsurans CBS 112818]
MAFQGWAPVHYHHYRVPLLLCARSLLLRTMQAIQQASQQANLPYSYAYPTKEPLSSPAARLSPHLHARMSHNFCLLGLLDSFIVKSSFCSGFLPRFLPGLLLALDRPAGLRGRDGPRTPQA